MFGEKLTRKHLVHGFHQAKNFLGHAYHETKQFLGDVDHGVKAFKHIYGAVAPVLDQYGAGGVHKHVMKAVSGYDNVKQHVLEQHGKVEDNVNQVRHNLGKKHVNFDFA